MAEPIGEIKYYLVNNFGYFVGATVELRTAEMLAEIYTLRKNRIVYIYDESQKPAIQTWESGKEL